MNKLDEKVSILKAYVFMNSKLGQEADVLNALQELEGIKNTHALYGIYDVLAEVEADSMDRIREIVFNKIRRLERVMTTITLIKYGESLIRD